MPSLAVATDTPLPLVTFATHTADHHAPSAANSDAHGAPDHASAGDGLPRSPLKASQDDSDDDVHDSQDESEEDEQEEARLTGPLDYLKQQLQAKQQKWMDSRRHPILEWKKELQWKQDHEVYRVAAQYKRYQEQQMEEQKIAKRERKEKRKHQQHVTKQKEREFRHTLFQYEVDLLKSETRARIVTGFQREDARKQKQRVAEQAEAKMQQEEQDKQCQIVVALEQDQQREQTEQAFLNDQIHVSAELGRRIGMLPAINTPPTCVSCEQDETSTELILRVNPARDGGLIKDVNIKRTTLQQPLFPGVGANPNPMATSPAPVNSNTKLLFFTVNMKRFKHVEEIKGEAIGDLGGVELARSLLTGACPRVKQLHLDWNNLKHCSIVALADCFVRGACGQLIVLDLRCNSIDANGVTSLLGAIDHGGLPELKELILQGNLLGDEGAKALAHAMLKGTLKLLKTIDIRQNRIRNAGILALWNVFTSECVSKCCPKLTLLDMRRNEAQGALTRSFCPCPPYLAF